MYENVFYLRSFNKIGGCESWLYYLSREYKNFVVFYSDDKSDKAQLDRLANNVEIHRYIGGRIKCKRFFLSYSCDILDYVDAEEYIVVIHANYEEMGLRPNLDKRITKYIGVSQVACDSFERISGRKCELIYNFVSLDKPKKPLLLISATRLTREKGKDRMIQLGNILDNAGVPYLWLVFTNDYNVIKNDNIVYMEPRLDITPYIAMCDYLVQLSDSESFCLSVCESLTVGTPVIVTDLPVFKELGLNKENSVILDMDLLNVNVDEIYKGKKGFVWKAPKDEWGKYLKKEGTYDPLKKVDVKARKTYLDLEFGEYIDKDKEFVVTEKRKNYLTDRDLVDIIELP